MAGNIIPAIATANAMTASLCVLQSFHVLRKSLPSARMIYLSTSNPKSATASGRLFAPNPKCPTCSVAMGQLYIDKERATMNDLVEDVIKDALGYEGEFSILTAAGVVYDPDMEENLSMKLADLGITGETFLSIRDEEDDEPHVQLDLYVSEKPLSEDAKPVELAEKVDVPRKPKVEAGIDIAIRQANGGTNGVGLKRDASLAGLDDGEARKKGKYDDAKSVETAIVIADDDGQITID
jgi:ubiquitin-like 1-activating enzyme E1 B